MLQNSCSETDASVKGHLCEGSQGLNHLTAAFRQMNSIEAIFRGQNFRTGETFLDFHVIWCYRNKLEVKILQKGVFFVETSIIWSGWNRLLSVSTGKYSFQKETTTFNLSADLQPPMAQGLGKLVRLANTCSELEIFANCTKLGSRSVCYIPVSMIWSTNSSQKDDVACVKGRNWKL